LAEDQTVIKSGYTCWHQGPTDAPWGDLTLTADELSFTWDGYVAVSEDSSRKAKQLIFERAERRQNSFKIPLDTIQAVRKAKVYLVFTGYMDVVTAERTYRLDRRKTWSQPIRDAVEALGKTVIDEPDGKGWRVI
jgi:hypothetical protein